SPTVSAVPGEPTVRSSTSRTGTRRSCGSRRGAARRKPSTSNRAGRGGPTGVPASPPAAGPSPTRAQTGRGGVGEGGALLGRGWKQRHLRRDGGRQGGAPPAAGPVERPFRGAGIPHLCARGESARAAVRSGPTGAAGRAAPAARRGAIPGVLHGACLRGIGQ